jgi:ferredoxin-nitrite reductase
MSIATETFTDEQKNYLQGFAAGSGMSLRSLPVLPAPANGNGQATWAATVGAPATPKPHGGGEDWSGGPESIHRAAQDRVLAGGKKLVAEEQAKRTLHGLDVWDKVAEHARDARFPKGTDVFLFKFQGMFYVAPAQDSFMCRLRFPGGIVSSFHLRGVADLAEEFGGGYADITTRANLQIRQIGPKSTIDVLMGLHELGIINRGAGADNIRNITASPTAGIDPQELIDTRPLARRLHHYILNHRELYGLPRKFNIAFDGGGIISALEDTNDIGFVAVRVGEGRKDAEGKAIESGVYFRMQLGGITGHKDFARDTGLLLTPEECVPVAAAVVRVFIDNGDRTDRKKARLKYVLDAWGLDKYLAEAEKHLGKALRRLPLDQCEPRKATVDAAAHIGPHPQRQPGLSYLGVVLPVGRMKAVQMRGLAQIADRYGSGTIRLTVWQNLLISDIKNEDVPAATREIEALGLTCEASGVRAGLVACTGNAGCKYAAANTKAHALQVADYLDQRLRLDRPINIHLTGCPHSCAQHFIGDIGLLATKIIEGDQEIEGYHVFVGGGYGANQTIGREILRNVATTNLGPALEQMLRTYLDLRQSEGESFHEFIKRHPTEQLREMFDFSKVTP